MPLQQAFPGVIESNLQVGLLRQVDGRIRLTPRGRLLANEVFASLVASDEAASVGKE